MIFCKFFILNLNCNTRSVCFEITGTVVIQLAITDNDSDETPVEYYITSGDPLCQFQIRPTGDVYITKLLDRESIPRYNLNIITTDGRHSTTTKLTVDILDANGIFF